MNGCVIASSEHVEEEIAKAGLSLPCGRESPGADRRPRQGGRHPLCRHACRKPNKHCEDLLFTELRGYKVNQLLIVEKSENNKTELYLSIMLDRLTKRPIIIFSANGGMEIEQTAKEDPDKIIKLAIDPFVGVKDYMAAYLLSRSGMDPQLQKAARLSARQAVRRSLWTTAVCCWRSTLWLSTPKIR